MTGLMDNPEFLRQMSDLMSRPEVVEQVSTVPRPCVHGHSLTLGPLHTVTNNRTAPHLPTHR